MSRRLWFEVGAIVVVMLLAIGFRFYDITNYPPGLFPDEAANGEDALLVLDGDVRAFYPRGNGREGLYYILLAAAIGAFGIGVWQLHVVPAAIGVASVLATYYGVRMWWGKLAAFLAALFLATSHWHVTMSRTGFRAILIPLFIALFTGLVGSCVQAVREGKVRKSYLYAFLAGGTFMGGFYTYIAYRAMVGVVLGIMIVLAIAAAHPAIGFPHFKRYGKQFLLALLAGFIVFAPLGWHFVQNPEEFVGRAGHVSVFNKELQAKYGGGTLVGTLLYSTQETLISFFAGEGDLNWRHNVAGYPLLNPLVGFLYLVGLIFMLHGLVMLVVKIVRGQEIHYGMMHLYSALLLSGMLLPVITTAEGLPHGLRSIGLIFPMFMMAGMAGAVLLRYVLRGTTWEWLRASGKGLVVAVLVLMIGYDGLLYFLVARNDAGAYYAYRSDLTEVSEFLKERAADPSLSKPYLVLDTFSVQTVHFLTSVQAHEYVKVPQGEVHPDLDKHIYRELDPARSHETEITGDDIIIFTQSTFPDADRYKETYGEKIELYKSMKNRFGEEILRVYRAK